MLSLFFWGEKKKLFQAIFFPHEEQRDSKRYKHKDQRGKMSSLLWQLNSCCV